ncbi:MAG: lipo-like protein [Betaproteobacteria bacterium]|nr:lipo-like protein [Betaproteobacteria bacterium]
MNAAGPVLAFLGRWLARYLSAPVSHYVPAATSDPEKLTATIRPGDVLLVEGNTRISTAIKYLTQSTWSHAALCVGNVLGKEGEPDPPVLIEADIVHGVWAVPLSRYASMHTRICRPVGLSSRDIEQVVRFAVSRLGYTYDLKNVVDLARYLLPTPPVPTRWRRRLLALGSGEPTRAVCSTLIAQAFQSIRYPILPQVSVQTVPGGPDSECDPCYEEILQIRHHSLFAPRDFDISPYFRVVKPTIEDGFDYRFLKWGDLPRADPKVAESA